MFYRKAVLWCLADCKWLFHSWSRKFWQAPREHLNCPQKAMLMEILVVIWICETKENLFEIPALCYAQYASSKNHKTKTSVDAPLILLIDAFPKSDSPNSHFMGQLWEAQSWSWLISPTRTSWKYSSTSVPTRTSPMCHLSANDSTKYHVTICCGLTLPDGTMESTSNSPTKTLSKSFTRNCSTSSAPCLDFGRYGH